MSKTEERMFKDFIEQKDFDELKERVIYLETALASLAAAAGYEIGTVRFRTGDAGAPFTYRPKAFIAM